jgi:hypothetical protein
MVWKSNVPPKTAKCCTLDSHIFVNQNIAPAWSFAHSLRRQQMNHDMMKSILLMALLAVAPWSSAQRKPIPYPGNDTGERFAVVTLSSGQAIRTLVSNVRIPASGDSTDPCALTVSFFGADGSLIGGAQTLQLAVGESETVSAGSASGLVRARVSLALKDDPKHLCAVKANLEVFDSHTGGTLFLVEGQNCIGAEPCVTPFDDPKGH